MFTGNMVTEAIPARVFALYKIVITNKNMTRNEVQELMEPSAIRDGSPYFSNILKTAQELNLVDIRDNNVVSTLDAEPLKNMDDLRKQVISKLPTFEDGQFYKVTNAIINLNEKIFEHASISDLDVLNYIESKTGQSVTAQMIRGWRFWAQFLGIGYMQQMTFLPNAYVFSKNVLRIINLTPNEEYDIDVFLNKFNQYGRILTDNLESPKHINLALSYALRELHDKGEIILNYRNDAKSNWILYPSNDSFNDPLTSIIYKGVKK